ncbi:unnamed protein product, partial [Closterium sp. NIES-53]
MNGGAWENNVPARWSANVATCKPFVREGFEARVRGVRDIRCVRHGHHCDHHRVLRLGRHHVHHHHHRRHLGRHLFRYCGCLCKKGLREDNAAVIEALRSVNEATGVGSSSGGGVKGDVLEFAEEGEEGAKVLTIVL